MSAEAHPVPTRGRLRAVLTRRGDASARPARGLRLDFDDPRLEQTFRRRDDGAARPRGVAAAVLGAAAIAGFAVLDPQVVPEDPGRLLVPRLIAITALTGAGILLARNLWQRRQPHVICVAGLMTCFCMDAMPFLAPVPMSYITGGNMLTALALFALLGIRTRIAYPFALLLLAGFAVTVLANAADFAEAASSLVFVGSAVGFGAVAAYMSEGLRRREFLNELHLAEERARSDSLLHNVLPKDIAQRLRHDSRAIAEGSEEVTVVFADVVDFTPLAARLPARELVDLLNALFSEFDEVCRRHGVEKIKTIGDAYMAVAGVPRPDLEHAVSAAEVALGWLDVARRFDRWPGELRLRVGISSGPVVAGVIGRDKFAYDLWGDTVNTASRMESHGYPGRVLVSSTTRELLGERYAFGEPIQTAVKGKGMLTAFLLERLSEANPGPVARRQETRPFGNLAHSTTELSATPSARPADEFPAS